MLSAHTVRICICYHTWYVGLCQSAWYHWCTECEDDLTAHVWQTTCSTPGMCCTCEAICSSQGSITCTISLDDIWTCDINIGTSTNTFGHMCIQSFLIYTSSHCWWQKSFANGCLLCLHSANVVLNGLCCRLFVSSAYKVQVCCNYLQEDVPAHKGHKSTSAMCTLSDLHVFHAHVCHMLKVWFIGRKGAFWLTAAVIWCIYVQFDQHAQVLIPWVCKRLPGWWHSVP